MPVIELPVIKSCEGCGACCMEQSSPPGYAVLQSLGGSWPEAEDWERFKRLPTKARVILKKYIDRVMSNSPPGDEQPCCWLDLETKQCRFYEHRPQICRDFEMGSEACRAWREDGGKS